MSEPRRKPKRIAHPKPAKPKVDDDLRALIAELDENRLALSVEGWFQIPWRDGWNAFELAVACYEHNLDEYASPRERDIHNFLVGKRGNTAAILATVYYNAGELLTNIDREDVSPFLYAALRCLQVVIANSSGGGVVYNDILRRAFDKTEPSQILADTVREYRCRDAIGTTAVLQSDRLDVTRRAFDIAWRRGLYHAAYALPHHAQGKK